MSASKAFEQLVAVMARLRGPDGCPWDREQTHDSVIPHLIEEAHETQEALAARDWDTFREELGDVLCQVIFHAQIAEQDERFTLEEVCQVLEEKLIRRHPHVFEETQVSGSDEVLKNWERIKQKEKKDKAPEGEHQSILSGVPITLPALMRAYRIGQKASRVGFEFPNLQEAIKKVDEELDEFKKELAHKDTGHPEPVEGLFHELGDLLFAIVNVARQIKIGPETALQETTRRFQKRFQFIESELAKQKKPLSDTTLEEMDSLWEKAKKETI